MATATRRYAPPHDDARLVLPTTGFRITLGGLIALATLLATMVGTYWGNQSTAANTQSTLKDHTTQIEKLSAKADAVQKEINDNDKNVQAKLSDLHEQTTVSNVNQETISKQLTEIGKQISALTLASAPRR